MTKVIRNSIHKREKGAANGVATLDGSGLVPAAQLPSYVDDVIEVADFASLPGTGETGKIYVTIDNGKTFRWTGSVYVEISTLAEAEIKALYEANADTNAFTDALLTKLNNIEANATADQTDSEIETAYDNQVSVVTQAEAEAGTATTVRRWTAQRVAQAIAALASGGGLSDGNYGDVTVSGGGTSISINNGAVDNSALADMTQATIKGRTSGAGTGPPTDLNGAQVRAIANVEDGATADQTDSEIETAYNNQVSVVTQAEAEAGTATTVRRWTAQRVAQAIAALASGGSTDDDAIHDNVASEISAITAKGTITASDIFLIEDAADSNNKKRITGQEIIDLIGGGGAPGVSQAITSMKFGAATGQAASSGTAYSIKVIPEYDLTVSRMQCYVSNAASSTVYMGIYNAAGNSLLAEASGSTSTVGLKDYALDSSVDLVAGTEYYFTLLEGGGAVNFFNKSIPGFTAVGRGGFVSGSPTGLPASVAGHAATTLGFWLQVTN